MSTLPELEPYRHLDPVTAEHDKATSRPADYWRGSDPRDVDFQNGKIIERAKRFAWSRKEDIMVPYVGELEEELDSAERELSFVADKRGDFEEL